MPRLLQIRGAMIAALNVDAAWKTANARREENAQMRARTMRVPGLRRADVLRSALRVGGSGTDIPGRGQPLRMRTYRLRDPTSDSTRLIALYFALSGSGRRAIRTIVCAA